MELINNTQLFEVLKKCCTAAILAVFFSSHTAYSQHLILAAADSAPTAYVENGQKKGVLVDVVTEAFRRAGYPIKIRLMPWARCLHEARKGNIDGVFSSFKFPEREAYLIFTDVPIIHQVESFFVRADSSLQYDGNLEKFRYTRIGAIYRTSYGPIIDRAMNDGTWQNINQTANSVDNMISMLISKRFDLVPSYRHIFLYAAKKAGVAGQIKELSPSVESVPSYLAFNRKRDYTIVIAAFNKAMNEMMQDKTFDSITNKYLK